MKKTISTSG